MREIDTSLKAPVYSLRRLQDSNREITSLMTYKTYRLLIATLSTRIPTVASPAFQCLPARLRKRKLQPLQLYS
ncbi:MAG: hypothetical protein CTY24_07235 [Methylobacter sp.]|nr:MAG: hypothetical protein CTY24_07235 [Methylobacter sp.]